MATRESGDNAPRERTALSVSTLYDSLVGKPWLLALILVISTFVAYQPTWHAGFIWDDDDHLTANPAMTAPHGLRMIWSSLATSRYYPLTLTSFWVQRRLWGLNPLPYHLVNVALHAANGVLIFFLLRHLQARPAWLAAMLWTLHPVNVESVAWITELKNTQSGLFFFLAVWCYLRSETGLRRRRWYGLALAFGLAAPLSKPSTVVLPLVLLLCVWWKRDSWTRADIRRIAPFFVFALGVSVLTVMEQSEHIQRAWTPEWNLAMPERFVIAGRAVWFYAWKVFWPVQLAFVYPHWQLDASRLLNWLPLAGLVAVGVLLCARRREPWARAGLFGGGFFVLSLLPMVGFFNVFYFRYSYVADHFQYLACLGLVALIAAAAATISEWAGPSGRTLGSLAGAAALLTLGVGTWRQTHVYQDSETLWRDTLAKNPRCWMARNNLGADLASSGQVQAAREQYEESLRINPTNVEAYNNLGVLFWQQGKLDEAIEEYRLAVKMNPDSAEAHSILGGALFQIGQREAAVEQYEQAVKIQPDSVEAHCSLGIVLQQLGELDKAITQFEQALRIEPYRAEAHYWLGNALQQAGRIDEAIREYERMLQLRPDSAQAHYNLGLALEKLGRMQEAIPHYEQALRIKPDFIQAQTALDQARAGR
ncbi:MAG TPA: tetratricopeptide repeat protein [Verrucomicrobiae bacterium]|nr:tetratricopeptide repeat protein [Verrucomicrobiae bacterium]